MMITDGATVSPRDVMLYSAVYAAVVCPSVCHKSVFY